MGRVAKTDAGTETPVEQVVIRPRPPGPIPQRSGTSSDRWAFVTPYIPRTLRPGTSVSTSRAHPRYSGSGRTAVMLCTRQGPRDGLGNLVRSVHPATLTRGTGMGRNCLPSDP